MSSNWRDFGLLLVAVICEVIGTTALKASESFTKPFPSLVVILGYGIAFYCFSIAVRSINLGIAYAIWSGIGIVLVTLLSWLIYGQHLDRPGILGIGLILIGVLILNLFSKTAVR